MPRKKPFSSKQKKQQLKERRQRKQASGPRYGCDSPTSDGSDGEHEAGMEHSTEAGPTLADSIKPQVDELKNVLKVNTQPASLIQGRYDPNKYRLHFFKDDKVGLARRREKACLPYKSLPQECLEMELAIEPDSSIDIPKRPPWDYSLTKHQLQHTEEMYFRRYLDGILSEHKSEELSYMEVNLETWRQLWRVLEMSDVFLIITDIRHPAMHFPPALYKYVTEDLKKSVIIVLNKVDLAPPSLVVAWQHYFKQEFPLVEVVCFSSFPKSKEEMEQMTNKVGKVVFKRRKRGTFRALGPKELHRVCESIVQSCVDLSSWKSKIEIDQGVDTVASDDDDDGCGDDDHPEDLSIIRSEHMYEEHEKYKDGVLTIGCVGYPNVGKSSVINGLMGKKVVSVSRTPGHTKHFQTIYLTPTVKLCDCPGLVFPSKIDRNLQILGGIYPIAQVRDPYSTICYLAERLDLPSILRVKPVDEDVCGKPFQWSAMDICESWADKRGFLTAKAARLDTYRSANNLLRMALDGRICLCLYPKGYVTNKDFWESHCDTVAFIDLQNMYTLKVQASADSDMETAESSTSETEAEQKNTEDSSKGRQSDTFVSRNPFALLEDDS